MRRVKNKQLFFIILVLIAIGCILIGNINVNAADDTPDGILIINADTYGKIQGVINNAHNSVGMKGIITFNQNSNGDYTMTWVASKYRSLKQDQKKIFMETLLKGVANNSSLTPMMKNKVYSFFENQDSEVSNSLRYLKEDMSADFIEARKWFAPFSSPISTFLGFGAIMIFTGLALSIIFDIVYLTIPMVQPILERGEDNKRPWGVSNEAWKVQKEMEDPNNKKSMMGLYWRRRMPIFFLTSFILAWLISGKIYDVVVYFLDWFEAM